MEKHISLIGILHIVCGALGLLTALLIYTILHLVGDFTNDLNANFILAMIANILAVVFAIFSIPGIIGGIGLIKRQQWARILILILSVLNLLNFPLGTALGVYSIWALVQPEIVAEFDHKIQNSKP